MGMIKLLFSHPLAQAKGDEDAEALRDPSLDTALLAAAHGRCPWCARRLPSPLTTSSASPQQRQRSWAGTRGGSPLLALCGDAGVAGAGAAAGAGGNGSSSSAGQRILASLQGPLPSPLTAALLAGEVKSLLLAAFGSRRLTGPLSLPALAAPTRPTPPLPTPTTSPAAPPSSPAPPTTIKPPSPKIQPEAAPAAAGAAAKVGEEVLGEKVVGSGGMEKAAVVESPGGKAGGGASDVGKVGADEDGDGGRQGRGADGDARVREEVEEGEAVEMEEGEAREEGAVEEGEAVEVEVERGGTGEVGESRATRGVRWEGVKGGSGTEGRDGSQGVKEEGEAGVVGAEVGASGGITEGKDVGARREEEEGENEKGSGASKGVEAEGGKEVEGSKKTEGSKDVGESKEVEGNEEEAGSRVRSVVALCPPAVLVGYQDDWLATSPSLLRLWDKAPFEPYCLPKPVRPLLLFFSPPPPHTHPPTHLRSCACSVLSSHGTVSCSSIPGWPQGLPLHAFIPHHPVRASCSPHFLHCSVLLHCNPISHSLLLPTPSTPTHLTPPIPTPPVNSAPHAPWQLSVLAICPALPAIARPLRAFLSDLAAVYEACSLGTFSPLLSLSPAPDQHHPPGMLPVPLPPAHLPPARAVGAFSDGVAAALAKLPRTALFPPTNSTDPDLCPSTLLLLVCPWTSPGAALSLFLRTAAHTHALTLAAAKDSPASASPTAAHPTVPPSLTLFPRPLTVHLLPMTHVLSLSHSARASSLRQLALSLFSKRAASSVQGQAVGSAVAPKVEQQGKSDGKAGWLRERVSSHPPLSPSLTPAAAASAVPGTTAVGGTASQQGAAAAAAQAHGQVGAPGSRAEAGARVPWVVAVWTDSRGELLETRVLHGWAHAGADGDAGEDGDGGDGEKGGESGKGMSGGRGGVGDGTGGGEGGDGGRDVRGVAEGRVGGGGEGGGGVDGVGGVGEGGDEEMRRDGCSVEGERKDGMEVDGGTGMGESSGGGVAGSVLEQVLQVGVQVVALLQHKARLQAGRDTEKGQGEAGRGREGGGGGGEEDWWMAQRPVYVVKAGQGMTRAELQAWEQAVLSLSSSSFHPVFSASSRSATHPPPRHPTPTSRTPHAAAGKAAHAQAQAQAGRNTAQGRPTATAGKAEGRKTKEGFLVAQTGAAQSMPVRPPSQPASASIPAHVGGHEGGQVQGRVSQEPGSSTPCVAPAPGAPNPLSHAAALAVDPPPHLPGQRATVKDQVGNGRGGAGSKGKESQGKRSTIKGDKVKARGEKVVKQNMGNEEKGKGKKMEGKKEEGKQTKGKEEKGKEKKGTKEGKEKKGKEDKGKKEGKEKKGKENEGTKEGKEKKTGKKTGVDSGKKKIGKKTGIDGGKKKKKVGMKTGIDSGKKKKTSKKTGVDIGKKKTGRGDKKVGRKSSGSKEGKLVKSLRAKIKLGKAREAGRRGFTASKVHKAAGRATGSGKKGKKGARKQWRRVWREKMREVGRVVRELTSAEDDGCEAVRGVATAVILNTATHRGCAGGEGGTAAGASGAAAAWLGLEGLSVGAAQEAFRLGLPWLGAYQAGVSAAGFLPRSSFSGGTGAGGLGARLGSHGAAHAAAAAAAAAGGGVMAGGIGCGAGGGVVAVTVAAHFIAGSAAADARHKQGEAEGKQQNRCVTIQGRRDRRAVGRGADARQRAGDGVTDGVQREGEGRGDVGVKVKREREGEGCGPGGAEQGGGEGNAEGRRKRQRVEVTGGAAGPGGGEGVVQEGKGGESSVHGRGEEGVEGNGAEMGSKVQGSGGGRVSAEQREAAPEPSHKARGEHTEAQAGDMGEAGGPAQHRNGMGVGSEGGREGGEQRTQKSDTGSKGAEKREGEVGESEWWEAAADAAARRVAQQVGAELHALSWLSKQVWEGEERVVVVVQRVEGSRRSRQQMCERTAKAHASEKSLDTSPPCSSCCISKLQSSNMHWRTRQV
ncbi:unnamed protein product [Closterium sp. Yama58-4]|nr:unnamed protein product [Closterium sp. Yama58-4]